MRLASREHRKRFTQHFTGLELVRASDSEKLPEGVCGRLQGVALRYGQEDYYGTEFAAGCLSKSIAERVLSRKVNVFEDHDKKVRKHVGVVSDMRDLGDTCTVIVDLFDTEDGRGALEYAKAVIAAGAETGFSVGFIPRKGEVVKDAAGMSTGVYRFLEIELRELSITPVPAVEGALVTGARFEDDDPEVLETALRGVVAALPSERRDAVLAELGYSPTQAPTQPKETATPAPTGAPVAEDAPSATGEGSRKMPMPERLKALRSTFVASA